MGIVKYDEFFPFFHNGFTVERDGNFVDGCMFFERFRINSLIVTLGSIVVKGMNGQILLRKWFIKRSTKVDLPAPEGPDGYKDAFSVQVNVL